MSKRKPAEVRQLAQLLQDKLIPWVQGGAPLVLLGAPPQTSKPLSVRTRKTAALDALPEKKAYPQRYSWPDRHLNSTSVVVLGCLFEGEADYRVHTGPAADGREWIVPIEQGTFFVVPPNTPFSDGGRVAWERPNAEAAFARGLLIHLRRDGASCHTYTIQKGKLWLHPYIFLYDFEAVGLGEKLLAEMQLSGGLAQPVPYLYLQLILRLLMRAVAADEYATLFGSQSRMAAEDEQVPPPLASPDRIVAFAAEHVRQFLSLASLSSHGVAESAGLSERHLNRLFCKEMGMSVYDYIQQQRDEKASDLLAHGSLPIHTVATYCGFRRLGVFSTWFARRHSCTPTEFRHRHQENVNLAGRHVVK